MQLQTIWGLVATFCSSCETGFKAELPLRVLPRLAHASCIANEASDNFQPRFFLKPSRAPSGCARHCWAASWCFYSWSSCACQSETEVARPWISRFVNPGWVVVISARLLHLQPLVPLNAHMKLCSYQHCFADTKINAGGLTSTKLIFCGSCCEIIIVWYFKLMTGVCGFWARRHSHPRCVWSR